MQGYVLDKADDIIDAPPVVFDYWAVVNQYFLPGPAGRQAPRIKLLGAASVRARATPVMARRRRTIEYR